MQWFYVPIAMSFLLLKFFVSFCKMITFFFYRSNSNLAKISFVTEDQDTSAIITLEEIHCSASNLSSFLFFFFAHFSLEKSSASASFRFLLMIYDDNYYYIIHCDTFTTFKFHLRFIRKKFMSSIFSFFYIWTRIYIYKLLYLRLKKNFF